MASVVEDIEPEIKKAIQAEDYRKKGRGSKDAYGVTIIIIPPEAGLPVGFHRSERFKEKDTQELNIIYELLETLISYNNSKAYYDDEIKKSKDHRIHGLQKDSEKQYEGLKSHLTNTGAILDDVSVFVNEKGRMDAWLIVVFDDPGLRNKRNFIKRISSVYRKLKELIENSREEFGYEFKLIEQVSFDDEILEKDFTDNFLMKAIDKYFTVLTNIKDY